MYYSNENRSWANVVTERQIDQEVMQNPYYGEVVDDAAQNNDKGVIEHSQDNFTAVTKIEMYNEQ